MSSIASTTILSLLLAVSACTKVGEDGAGAKVPPNPKPTTGDVTVELAGVTLGDDCGGSWAPPPPAKPAPNRKAPAAAASAPMRAPAECVEPDCGGGAHVRYACQQTSIQLSLHANGMRSPTAIKIKKVELLDAKGVRIADLTASPPTKWTDAGSYQPWDGMIAPDEQAAVSYVLSSPAWHTMEGGQYAQTGKTFQVRVTVVVGDKDRVVEKKAIQPAIVPPAAPT